MTVLVALSAGFLPAGCGSAAPTAGKSAAITAPAAVEGAGLLPKAPARWKGPQVTVARSHEDIEEIIDGEAHQYYAYDLVSLTHAVYRGPSDEQAVVDVYRMPSAADAFGVCSLWREGAAAVESIGDEGTQSDGEVRFYKGRLFVRILVDESAADAGTIARNLAEQVAGAAPSQPVSLPHLGCLPAADRLPNTLIYVKRNFRSQEFLNNAVAAKYQSAGKRPYQLFICAYPSADQAAEALERLIEAAPQPRTTGTGAAGSGLGRWVTYADEFDGEVTVFQAGARLVGATAGQSQKAQTVAEKLAQ
jgi:hypothetical protein